MNSELAYTPESGWRTWNSEKREWLFRSSPQTTAQNAERGIDMSKHRTELHQNLINRVNTFLKDSPDDAKPTREILASVLSSFLMEADSYRGFNYIYWTETGCEQWRAAGQPEGTGEKDEFIYGPSGDQSRIVYY